MTYNHAIEQLRYAADNRARTGQPFFQIVGFKRPHLNWRAPASYLERYPLEQVAVPKQLTLDRSIDPVAYTLFNMYAPLNATAAGASVVTVEGATTTVEGATTADAANAAASVGAAATSGGGGVPDFVTSPYVHGTDTQLKLLRQHYYAAVSWADFAAGKVLDELDALRLTNDTMVVMHSDHGVRCRGEGSHPRPAEFALHSRADFACCCYYPAQLSRICSSPNSRVLAPAHTPRHAPVSQWHLGEYAMWEKRTNWELGTRVPLIMRVPWLPQSVGQRSRALVELVDVYPTICDSMPHSLELDPSRIADMISLLLLLLCHGPNLLLTPPCPTCRGTVLNVPLPQTEAVPLDGYSLRPLLERPTTASVKDVALSTFPRCAHAGMPSYGQRGLPGGDGDNSCLYVEKQEFTWMG